MPRDRGIEAARKLRERGVKVRVLTNYLSANDVLAAHAGYSKYREDLIRAGVFIGSFKLDPRSAAINTEAGIYVESPELARQVIEKDGFRLDYEKDPNSRRYQRWIGGLIRVLPVEKQL